MFFCPCPREKQVGGRWFAFVALDGGESKGGMRLMGEQGTVWVCKGSLDQGTNIRIF